MQYLIGKFTEKWQRWGQWVSPNLPEALGWITSEVGEAWDAHLSDAGDRGFVRNNPDREKESVASELGDIVFMCFVAANILGVDLEKIIQEKLERTNAKKQAKAGQDAWVPD